MTLTCGVLPREGRPFWSSFLCVMSMRESNTTKYVERNHMT